MQSSTFTFSSFYYEFVEKASTDILNLKKFWYLITAHLVGEAIPHKLQYSIDSIQESNYCCVT